MLSDRPVSSTAARKFTRALSRKRRGSKQEWRWTCASSRIVRDVLSVHSAPDVEPQFGLNSRTADGNLAAEQSFVSAIGPGGFEPPLTDPKSPAYRHP